MDITTANKYTMNLMPVKPEIRPSVLVVTLIGVFFSIAEAAASEWKFAPSIKLASTYSDNIDRDTLGDSDVVLEMAPGIKVNRDSRRFKLNLDYRLQNLSYVDDSDRDATNHGLSTNLSAEAIDETIFVDFSSSISQQLIDRKKGTAGDLISGSGNLSDVYTYSVSPYWQERLGNIAEWELRYTHDTVTTDQSGNDSDGNGVSLSLENGSGTGKLSWVANYNQREVSYDDGDSSDTELATARASYQLFRTLSAVVSGTYEDNQFAGDRGNIAPDDSTVGAGFTWTPSRDFSTTILYNDRLDPGPGEDPNFISTDLFWAPTARTDINVSYGNRFFGETYNGTLTHRSRWTRWNLSYDESISDFRSTLLQTSLIACPSGATTLAQCRFIQSGEALQQGESILNNLVGITTDISEDTFISKTGRASVSIVGSRNTVTLAFTDISRTFVADGMNERDNLIDLSWTNHITPRTNSRVSVGRGTLEFDDGEKDDSTRYSWRVTNQVGSDSIIYVEAQYYDLDSNIATRRYDESRITVSFEKFF